MSGGISPIAGPPVPVAGPAPVPRDLLHIARRALAEVFAPTAPAAQPARQALLHDLVRDALEAGQPRQALVLLERFGPELAGGPALRFLQGESLHQLGRWADATAVLRHGLAESPTSTGLRWLLADCERRLGDAPAAERTLRAALALVPDEPLLLASFADLCAAQGRLDEADRCLAQGCGWADTPPLPTGRGDRLRAGRLLLEHDERRDQRCDEARALAAAQAAGRPRVRMLPSTALGTARLCLGSVGVVLAVGGERGLALVLLGGALLAPMLLAPIRRPAGRAELGGADLSRADGG